MKKYAINWDSLNAHINQDDKKCYTFKIDTFEFYLRPTDKKNPFAWDIFHMPYSIGICPVCYETVDMNKRCSYSNFYKKGFLTILEIKTMYKPNSSKPPFNDDKVLNA